MPLTLRASDALRSAPKSIAWERLEQQGGGVRPFAAGARLKLRLPRGARAVPAARHALAGLESHVGPETLANLELLVSELVSNSVRHAGTDVVTLEVVATGSGVRVEVSDRGEGFEPEPPPSDQERAGGWGLYLVDQLADRWGVQRSDATVVWFEIEPQAAAA
jgi:anti-sigma regulatory factor (Ser/Thr protein kinase)